MAGIRQQTITATRERRESDGASAPESHVSPRPRFRDPYLLTLLLILVLAIGVRCFLLTAHATEEDFFITLRYARNLAAGHGFVYNPGARVLGTTTPLYTLVLALWMRLHVDPILGGKLLGIGADALACWATYRLGRAIGRPGAGLAAAVCVALLPVNLIWATKGMEVGEVAAAVAMTWAAWAERREIAAWAAAAVLVLLRIDGMALVAFLLLGTLLYERRLPWRGLLLFGALLLPWLVFATLYFGSPVPLSVAAKLQVYSHYATTPFPHLREFVGRMAHNVGAVLLVGCAVALVALIAALARRRTVNAGHLPPEIKLVVPALWMMTYYAGMALSPVFLFGWYFVPPTPVYYLVAMTGWSLLLEWMLRGRGREFLQNAAARNAAVIGACLLLIAFATPRVREDLRSTQETELTLRIPIGLWLRDHARSTDTVMLEPIGYIGYYSGLRVLDVVGLVSPEVLPYWNKQVACPRHELWQRFRPEWILLRAGEWAQLQQCEAALPPSERLTAQYALAREWPGGSKPLFALFRRNDVPVGQRLISMPLQAAVNTAWKE